MAIIEDLCEIHIAGPSGQTDDTTTFLRLSVAEACRNALARRPAANRIGTVRLAFFHSPKPGATGGIGALEITDSGAGFGVNGDLPPYPREAIGKTVHYMDVLDCRLMATVRDAASVRIEASAPANGNGVPLDRELLIARAQPRGLGLLALCRCWREVLFTHEPGVGTTLRLSGPLVVRT